MSQSIRTPLSRARGLGSAKDGTHHFIMQRLSAIAMIPSAFYLLWNIDMIASSDAMDVLTFLNKPLPALAMIIFVISSFYHAMLGVQTVIEDYIHCTITKPVFLALNKIVFFFLGVASVFAAMSISLQG